MPDVRDSTQVSVTTQSVGVINRPTVLNGDWVYLVLATRGSTTVAAPPAGWEPVPEAMGGTSSTASGNRLYTYRHRVTDAGSEPATYTWTMSTSQHGSAVAVSVSGLAAVDPELAVAYLGDNASADGVVDIPAVNLPTAGALALLIGSMSTSLGVASWSTPGADAKLEDVATTAATNRASMVLASDVIADAGESDPYAFTVTLQSGATFGTSSGLVIAFGVPAVVATAGPDITTAPGELVEIDCSDSSGDILSRNLTQVSGPYDITPYIANRTTDTPTLLAPAPLDSNPGVWVLRETVTGEGNTDTDDMTLTVTACGAVSPGTGGPGLPQGILGPDGLAIYGE